MENTAVATPLPPSTSSEEKIEKLQLCVFFSSYEEIKKHIDKFCDDNYHPMILYSHTAGVRANFKCRHGCKRASNSKGIRPCQTYSFLNCKAAINIKTAIKNPKKWLVSSYDLEHNHPIGREEYLLSKKQRRKVLISQIERIEAMLDVNAKDGSVAEIISRKTNLPIKRVDIRNFRNSKAFKERQQQEETSNAISSIVVDENVSKNQTKNPTVITISDDSSDDNDGGGDLFEDCPASDCGDNFSDENSNSNVENRMEGDCGGGKTDNDNQQPNNIDANNCNNENCMQIDHEEEVEERTKQMDERERLAHSKRVLFFRFNRLCNSLASFDNQTYRNQLSDLVTVLDSLMDRNPVFDDLDELNNLICQKRLLTMDKLPEVLVKHNVNNFATKKRKINDKNKKAKKRQSTTRTRNKTQSKA